MERKQEPINASSQDDALGLLAESLLYYPQDVPIFPVGFENIRAHQVQDAILLTLLQQGIYTEQEFYGTTLICSLQNGQQKIVLPAILQEPAIKWYHIVMGHGRATRLYGSLHHFFFSPKLKAKLEEFVLICDSC